ncbi:glycosyltransferase [Desulforhopalus sp. 52FAK]
MNIKKVVLVLLRLCVSGEYRRLRKLKIFDSGYYLSCKGQSVEDDLDPLWTYVRTGRESVDASLHDDSGWSQQADPHPLFDTSYYLSHYFSDGISQNPLLHYLTVGWKSGYRPGPFFDPVVYGKNSGWSVNEGDPLTHYVHYGKQQCLSPSLAFDFAFYFDKNPVLAGVGEEIIKHYKLHGASIGKSPLPVFDPQFYTEQVGGGKTSLVDPLSHYLSTAHSSTTCPAQLFEPDFYRGQCDVDVSRGDALTHYVSVGVFKCIYPHPRVASLPSTPVISILVPVYNPEPAVLRNCIRSVLYQAYPHWELCLVDDCSPREDVRPLLTEWAEKDSRIKVDFHRENGGIAKATNSARALATGSYLGFLDNDDELTVDCLLEVVETLTREGADMVYSDEDLIGDDGTTLSIFRKPGFNQNLLLSHNYITHFVVVKEALFDRVGGLDCRYDGAQDYDFMLKLSEQCDSVVHIPKVLYHWRASESSTSINHDQKNYAHEAGRLALEMALKRRKIPCKAVDTELNFFYRLQATSVKGTYAVFIWAEEVELFSPEFIASITSITSTPCDDELIIDVTVITGEDRSDTLRDCIHGSGGDAWNIVTVAKGEGKAEVLQRLISESRCANICLLDGNIRRLSDNWLFELAAMSVLPDVAIVCGRTSYSGGDGISYLLPDIANRSGDYLYEFLCNSSRHMAGLHCLQDMSFSDWDITLIKKDCFEAVGGFSTKEYPNIFATADLSLRLTAAGKKIVYNPFAIADRKERSTSGLACETDNQQEEKRLFQALIQGNRDKILPYYNRSLLCDRGVDETEYLDWLFGKD